MTAANELYFVFWCGYDRGGLGVTTIFTGFDPLARKWLCISLGGRKNNLQAMVSLAHRSLPFHFLQIHIAKGVAQQR